MECGENIRKKWEIVNSFLNRIRNSETITEITHQGMVFKTAKEIAYAFTDFFFSSELQTPVHVNPVPRRVPQSFFLFPTTSQEALNVINNMKITGVGMDKLHPFHIKLIAPLISDILADLINIILAVGWHHQEVSHRNLNKTGSLQYLRNVTDL